MLNGKTIVISGASSGIGKETAILFSSLGANCVLIGRDTNNLLKTRDLCSGRSMVITMDFTDFMSYDVVLQNILTEFGKISGFVHSAGIEQTKLIQQLELKDLISMFNINVFSGIEFSKNLVKKKYRDEDLSIIFMSSVMGIVGNKGLTAYSATKGALIAATKSMALELASKKIRVNCVSPGHIADSEMSVKKEQYLSDDAVNRIRDNHPLGLGRCRDVAELNTFLISNKSRWITGQNFIIDGGYSIQ